MLTKFKGLVFGCALIASTAVAQKAGSFEPILETELDSSIPALLTLSAIETDSRKIEDQAEADKLYSSMGAALKGKKVSDPADPLYKDAVALLQFYLLQGRSKDSSEKVKIAGSWLEQSAQQFSDASGKNPDLQARTAYLAKVGRFIKTDGADGISDLIPLKEKLKNSRDALANVDLLIGYSLAFNATTTAEGLRLMNSVSNQVSIYGRLAQKLTEAMLDYGLDADGNVTGSAKPGAETKLTYSVQIARGMSAGPQHLVMGSAIYIWTQVNGSKGVKAPGFLRDGFPGIIPVESLRERDALLELQAQKFKEAAAAYRKIAAAFPKSEIGTSLDQRVWDIELANYQKNGQLVELETAFMDFRERYQGKRGFSAYLVDSYRKTVDSVLELALSNNMSKPLQATVAQAAARFARIETDRAAAANMKFKVAQIYRGLQMYKEAVDLYVELAKDQPLKHYLLAIEAQSQLASWPTLPNLANVPAAKQPERARLLAFYEIVNQLKKGDDWFILAHIGALNRALGQPKNAENLWLKSLKANSGPKIALEAGGTLLSEFMSAKRWAEVIDLCHLFASRKQTPTLASKAVNYKPWLADALYNGGTADLGSNNLNRSVKYLEEFVQVFPSEARAPAANYSLAFAYKGLNKLTAALNVSKSLVEKFPTYPLRGKVLLQAGEWAAADRANWEFAFFFYGKYLSDYRKEANIPQIRMTLADLYMKRKLYGWAARLYKEQSQATNVPKDQRLAAAVKALEIEDQFGEAAEANRFAPRVLDLAGPQDPARFKALAIMGRFAANSKDLNAMNGVEAKLLPLNKGNRDVLEALGLIRFKRAEMMTKSIFYGENNLTIKDPEAVVKKYYERFEQERRHYLSVCQIGVSSYCAPSLMRLVTVAKQGVEALDKVTIADTLGPNRVNSFKVTKQLYASKILQSRKDYINEALRLAKAGTTTPIWKEEVIKNLEYE